MGQVQAGAETRKGPQADEKAAPWRKGERSHRSFQKRPGFRGLHIVDPRGKREAKTVGAGVERWVWGAGKAHDVSPKG